MNMNMNMNHMNNMNSQALVDNFKSMVLTMAMVKGSSNSDSSQSSFMNTIILMLLVSFIDTIVLQVKKIFSILASKFERMITNKTNMTLMNKLSLINTNVKKASIIIKIEMNSKNPTSDALIDMITLLPHTKCILFQNGIYTINYSEEIEISKNLYAKLVSGPAVDMIETTADTGSNSSTELNANLAVKPASVSVSVSNSNPIPNMDGVKGGGLGYIDIYSYTYDMETLRNELNGIVKNYLIKMTNKLGNNIYYFSEMPLTLYRDSNGKVDHSKMPDYLHFSMKQFITNRSFKNLFGKDIDIIKKRVDFFRYNKDWYDNKGVPYTLGILVSGNPGSGKTSIIKCIANETKRHIINIHLSDSMTKTQIENLFYNEQICVTQNGKTETYTIPIDKRIYVLEDVDCQCDIILDRGSNTVEQILAKKNAELKAEISKLQYALNEISSGKKMVMTNGKMMEPPKNKNENANEKITLSFLLNLFDGVLETPGRITFMTTNFVDKLDKAFTRPGRIDVISKFGFADHSQLIDIIQHRYDTKLTDEQLNMICNIPCCITPAEVGRILFENFDSLDGALQGLEVYANEYMLKDQTKKEKEEETNKQLTILEEQYNKEDIIADIDSFNVKSMNDLDDGDCKFGSVF